MSHSPYNPLIGNSHMGRSDLSPLNSDSGRSLNSLQQPLYSPQTNPPLSVAAIHTGQTMNHASPGQPVLQSPQQSEIFGMPSPNMVASNPSPGIPVQSQHPVGDLSSVLSNVNQEVELPITDLMGIWDVSEVQPLPENVTSDGESPYINQGKKIFDLIDNGSDVVRREIDRMWLDCSESVFTITIRRHFADVIEWMRWDKVTPQDENQIAHKLTSKLYGLIHQELKANEFTRDHEFRYALQRLLDKLADIPLPPSEAYSMR